MDNEVKMEMDNSTSANIRNRAEESTSKETSRLVTPQKFFRIFVWPISIVASAFLTSSFKDYWEAPRPVVELTEFKTIDPSPEDSLINIDPEIIKSTSVHPYLESLEPRMTRADLRSKLRTYQDERNTEGAIAQYILRLISLLQTQSAAIPVEKRRRDFLQLVSDEPSTNSIIEQASLFVLDDYEGRLGPEYQSHPPGTQNAKAVLSHSVYDLSEVDESKVEQGRNRLQTHRTNLYKRLLLYYNQDLLVDFFGAVRRYTLDNNEKADAIVKALDNMLDADAHKKIAIGVLVTNRGQRPAAILPFGILRLEIPSSDSSKPPSVTLIKLTSREGGPDLIVIDGGKAQMLRLISTQTVLELIQAGNASLGGDGWTSDKPLDSSRLMMLFRGRAGGLTASVALARAGVEPQKALVGPSKSLSVTSAGAERTLEQLSSTWN
ncbi:MAG TPA: hypothetical protein VLB76_06320 [Thermoanaerobaculia bacterium]|nr:hypothetical protein [Thermoanaerobaculia bacterium]